MCQRVEGGGRGCVGTCFSRTDLVVVVVGQALAVKSHPPPLENTFSAKRRARTNSNQTTLVLGERSHS